MVGINIILLAALIKVLQVTDNPILCAGIYAVFIFFIALFNSQTFGAIIITSIVAFLSAWLYFWLLSKLEGSFLWWIVLIVGLLIGFI